MWLRTAITVGIISVGDSAELFCFFFPSGLLGRVGTTVSEPLEILAISLVLNTLLYFKSESYTVLRSRI
jgi:hypothetical protein